jgi:hypothetical protein
MPTPIRTALLATSALQAKVCTGLVALKRSDKAYLDEPIRSRFVDSLEIDENLKTKETVSANRWDYLLGDDMLIISLVVGLEPHGARDGEVSVLIRKRRAALDQLRLHLRDGQRVSAWFWVQSSGGGFTDTGKARRQADQNGITFVGRKLMASHLASLAPAKSARRK